MTKYFTKDGDKFVEVESNLLTQTEVDSVIDRRLERERSRFSDYESLKEQAEKTKNLKQEFEDKLKQADEQRSELEKKLTGASLETKKVRIMSEFRIKPDLEEFVFGDDEEEMRKRAEKLSKNAPTSPPVDKDPKPKDDVTDSSKIAGELFGGKSDD